MSFLKYRLSECTMLRNSIFLFSNIQLGVYYECCVLISYATTRLYVIAH